MAETPAPVTPASVSTVLVANRGEIARRVFATLRRTGRGAVAVYSDADTDAPHVREADAAVRLPGAAPSETYLRADLIVRAALDADADAIHPGYGFLSENADFARAVTDAGLTWIGPPAEAIETMGSKVESKKIMAEAGVPVLEQLDPATVTEDQLPVLIKASSGGGGRGMRVVRSLADLPGEIEAARTEAASAFGDPTVFCERYLPTGHHIEVQIMADAHGGVWPVGERECSIQRRHQKVVEEAPAPLVERLSGTDAEGAPTGMRARLFDASRLAAEAIGYTGAGTVEFLAAEDGSFYFLEMNTRLQVEHPVTELTVPGGVDLVDWQLRVAEGERIPGAGSSAVPGAGPGAVPDSMPDDEPARRGHAIEVRLYAEDPAQDWQPQSGTVHAFEIPGETARFAAPAAERGVRVDAGIASGSVVGVHYDPMLAKVIAWAPTRGEAARVGASALSAARIHGLVTNRDLLVRVLRHPAFLAGDTDTAFFDRHGLDALAAPLCSADGERASALAAALAQAAANRASATVLPRLPSGWRNVPSQPQRKVLRSARETHEVDYRLARGGLMTSYVEGAALESATPHEVVLTVGGLRRRFSIARYGDPAHGQAVYVDSALGPCAFTLEPRFTDPADVQTAGSLLAPMPGTVTRLGADVGQTVSAGEPILWLEAMKMEHTIAAPADGVLTELNVAAGRQVEVGAVLAVVSGEPGGPREPGEPGSAADENDENTDGEKR